MARQIHLALATLRPRAAVAGMAPLDTSISRMRVLPTDLDVYLHVNNGVELYDDALASVRTSGLIGDKYILMSPGGSGEPLKDGDEVSDTESALDLESMIGK